MSLRAHDRAWRRCVALAAVLATAAIALVSPATGAAAVTIGAEAESPSGWEFGTEPYDATAGQVVTAPAGITSLRSFTLWLQDPPAFTFQAYVYAWNGTGATGPALYESGDLHTAGESGFEAAPVTTGGVDVTPGQQYVLFLSRSADETADAEVAANDGIETAEAFNFFEEIPPPYTEGKFVFLNNASGWTSRTWFERRESDARFEATFDTPAPPGKTPETPVEAPKPTPVTPTTPASTPVQHCVVPALAGLKLVAVKKALKAADCSLGTVDRHFFGLAKGELMEQKYHQGAMLPVGTKVDVWLSRGAHKRHHER